jgi:hypothetical protein
MSSGKKLMITYLNEKDFYDGIMEMVMRSLKFKADYDHLTITLTGGF